MITPAFGLTATERVLPRLALDFTTAVLDPRVTVTRALNTATRVNSSGVIEIVNADLPRFDYDPTTLQCKGILIEETRTNSLLNSLLSGGVSGSPGTAPTSWLQYSSGTTTTTYESDPLFSGGSTVTFTNTVGRNQLSRSVTLSANTTYVVSISCTVVSGTPSLEQMLAWIYAPAGATVTYTLNGVSRAGNYIAPVGTHTLVMTMVVGATAGTIDLRFGVGIQGNLTATARFARPQLEIGAFATSYIPTTTTSLTRNADVVSMTGTNFSSWYNASEGTFVAGLSSVNRSGNTVGFLVGNFNDGMYCLVNTGGNYFNVRSGGADQANIGSQPFTAGTNTVVCSYKANSFATALNGNAVNTDLSGLVPTVSSATLGSLGFGLFLNGWMSEFYFYPQQLTLAETQAFSKG